MPAETLRCATLRLAILRPLYSPPMCRRRALLLGAVTALVLASSPVTRAQTDEADWHSMASGDEILAGLPADAFPASIEVKVHDPERSGALTRMAEKLRLLPRVEAVETYEAWGERLSALLGSALIGAAVLTLIVLATVAPAAGAVTATSVGAAVSGAAFDTVTVIPAEVVWLPAASRARTLSVCAPLAVEAVFQFNAYGALVSSAPNGAPSSRNCTAATPTLSLALARQPLLTP